MELINTVLSGFIMPALLMSTGLFLGAKLRFFYVFHPIRTIKDMGKGHKGCGISPFRALTQALAGTLGVGNMTGVATAICSGGAGAIFWMWVSATLAMSVKYFEVILAVKYRKRNKDGYCGGAMYYIKGVFSHRFPRFASVFAAVFAVLCICNSILTGNVIQIRSAAEAVPAVSPPVIGAVCAAAAIPVVFGKSGRVSAVTSFLIPLLSGVYILLSLIIIIPSAKNLPSVFEDIFKSAFSLKAAGGGIGGYVFLRAIRFGTTRGIFSNEAGSGTSPTAHAEANTNAPHSQGCLGIFEVFADTIILCTLTSLVILLSDGCALGYTGIALTLYAFSSQAGSFSGTVVSASVILFAYATIICQTGYGTVALRYLTKSPASLLVYLSLSSLATVFGTMINDGIMWQVADFIISLMTALNVFCLIYAAKEGHFSKKDLQFSPRLDET